MNAILCWLNNYNGALMVLITLVYVIATISISRSNRKSAEASREQIAASQKQQEQNVGLQLYAIRREIINKLSKKQYNEIYWDIPLLFNEELFSEFQKVAYKAGKIDELQQATDKFELELGILVGEKIAENVEGIRKTATSFDDPNILKNTVLQYLSRISNRANLSQSVEEYVKQVIEAKELTEQRDAETIQLILKLREFVKESIQ